MRAVLIIVAITVAGFLLGRLIWEASPELRAAFGPGAVYADEACQLELAGSNTIGERLAPELASAFLSARGFSTLEAPGAKAGEVRVRGDRDRETCVIAIRSHGSALSFQELDEGTADIGMSSRPIKPQEVEMLSRSGAGDFLDDSGETEHVIGLDGIAVIVHPSNPIASLSKAQVKDAFLGRIRDWSELGGRAGPINLYARDDHSGTFQFFQEHVLADNPAWDTSSQSARRFESSSELVAEVAADIGAIGFVGMAYVGDDVRALPISDGGAPFAPSEANVRSESYPISRRLFLYVRPATMSDNALARQFIAFAKSEGAYGIAEGLGYVSLRPFDRAVLAGGAQTADCTPDTPEAQVYHMATAQGQRLASVIRFQPSSDAIDSLGRDDIERVAPAIRNYIDQGVQVRLIGHTDASGDAERNRQIALERALAARAAFERRNVLGVQVESAGEQCPVASNETAAGRQTNRRVEIWIVQTAG